MSCHVLTSTRSRLPLLIPSAVSLFAAETPKLRPFATALSATAELQAVKSTPMGRVAKSTRNSSTTIAAAAQRSRRTMSFARTAFRCKRTVTGNDYLKAPVDERFTLENGVGTWKSTSENGHAEGTGFYISNNGPAAESAFLVSALLKAKGAPLKLFPAGEARLEKMTDVTLDNHGQKLHVTEYAITGLSFEPQTVWLDDDLHFFAVPGKWFAIMREGWEGTNDQLYALDRSQKMREWLVWRRNLAQHPSQPIAIEHVRVFDSEQASIREDQTVVIDGDAYRTGWTVCLGENSRQRSTYRRQRQNPASRPLRYARHVQPVDGMLNIASGVTTVRDMGNDIDDLNTSQDQWDSGAADRSACVESRTHRRTRTHAGSHGHLCRIPPEAGTRRSQPIRGPWLHSDQAL